MRAKNKAVLAGVLLLAAVSLAAWRLSSFSIPILQPRGVIAQKERNLMFLAIGLCAIVVIPVYAMLIGFAWKYRESNQKARYEPDFDHSRLFESLWWGIPLAIIAILAGVAWRSSHELDPFKSLSGTTPPLTVQAVALQWKWLFIYPNQGVASVNYLMIPVNTPVNFQITADAPMNSLWIPQLGGQVYAMSGMSTQLHLEAAKAGTYYGSSANISGDGFADMHFMTDAKTKKAFDGWIKSIKDQSALQPLDNLNYAVLAKPGSKISESYYAPVQAGLYSYIVNKFITPPNFSPVVTL